MSERVGETASSSRHKTMVSSGVVMNLFEPIFFMMILIDTDLLRTYLNTGTFGYLSFWISVSYTVLDTCIPGYYPTLLPLYWDTAPAPSQYNICSAIVTIEGWGGEVIKEYSALEIIHRGILVCSSDQHQNKQSPSPGGSAAIRTSHT